MKRMTLVIAAVGCMTLPFTACDLDGKKVRARFKFEPGMNLHYEQVTKGSVREYKADSLTWDGYGEVHMYIDWFVRRVMEDSVAEIVDTKKWKRKSFNAEDSLISDTSEITEGTPVIMYIKPNGKLVDIKPANEKQNESKVSYLKSYYEQCQPVFPDRDLTVGYSWTQTTKVLLPEGPMDASTTYTVKSFGRDRGYDCVVIEYDGIAIIPFDDSSMEDKDTTKQKSQDAEEKKKYDKLLNGVDKITAKGSLYFAYMEGITVSLRERWHFDSDRKLLASVGDTVNGKTELVYDVDYYLASIDRK